MDLQDSISSSTQLDVIHDAIDALKIKDSAAGAHNKPQYVGNYEIIKTIGEGSFAKVKLGKHRLSHLQVQCI